MLGYDEETGEYVMHLFDTFGPGYARTVGTGSLRGQSVTFLFDYPGGLFSNTFTWYPEQEAVVDESRRGCFMTNSMVELAPHDPAVAEIARRNLDEATALFTIAIRRGQAQGEVDDERDAEALAHYLFNAILGLRVLAKSTRERAVLTNVAETTLQILA